MRVGFTCGVFDLVHAGHVLALGESKAHCDYLIVGLEADPTTYKPHKNKPIQSVYERTVQLQGCKYVDEVFVYNNGDELLTYLEKNKSRIDVRLVGADWQGKDFIGKDIIPVTFTSRDHKYSSTELRERILATATNEGVLFRNRHTGMLVHVLVNSFYVEEESHQVVYMEQETGRVYSRERSAFYNIYVPTGRNPQDDIKPEVDYE